MCPFGVAFVDTPKGDLDSSGTIEGPDDPVIPDDNVYITGTTEQFPATEDSDLNVLTNTAHGYMECSNAGLCNRGTGVCECFEGFEGTSCHRQVCPGDIPCSGRGVCQGAYQRARKDGRSTYLLWDQVLSRGCVCDPEYFGGDCSMRHCPFGLDPLYLDDVNVVKIAAFHFGILTTSNTYDFFDGIPDGGVGTWSINFYDLFNQQWATLPLSVGASCSDVVSALESLPQNIIPSGSLLCAKTTVVSGDPFGVRNAAHTIGNEWTSTFYSQYDQYLTGLRLNRVPLKPAYWSAGYTSSFNDGNQTGKDRTLTGDVYRIVFNGNPGALPQPQINIHTDGTRPSLQTKGTLFTSVWTDGQQGESMDYFGDNCPGVRVTVAQASSSYYYLRMHSPDAERHLKSCLGGADSNALNNVDVYNWDHGSTSNPHVVKLVRTVTTSFEGSYYVMLLYDTSSTLGSADGTFRLLHPFVSYDNNTDADFYVFTTTGYAQLAGNQSQVTFDFASNLMFTTNTTDERTGESGDGAITCEAMKGVTSTNACLEKGDIFFVLEPNHPSFNPPYLNMYTVAGLYSAPAKKLVPDAFPFNKALNGYATGFYRNVIVTDLATNWAAQAVDLKGRVRVYKFYVDAKRTFHVVGECANRGVCNHFEGMCDCFGGYSGGNCAEQVYSVF